MSSTASLPAPTASFAPDDTPAHMRRCDTTGMSVCLAAEKFIKLNAVAAVVFLLLGGIAAILLALTRWQAVHLLRVDWFYRILTFHGLNMLIFWILFFEVAVLYFACTVPLKARLFSKKVAWVSFGLMLSGAGICVAGKRRASQDCEPAGS